jgi:hypothetical protein
LKNGGVYVKKTIVIIITTFFLCAVVLSGCNEQDNSSINPYFIGIWKPAPPENAEDVYNDTWTFYENNTLKIRYSLDGEVFKNYHYWHTKDDNLLCIWFNPDDEATEKCFVIKFTNSKSFLLSREGNPPMEFNKLNEP